MVCYALGLLAMAQGPSQFGTPGGSASELIKYCQSKLGARGNLWVAPGKENLTRGPERMQYDPRGNSIRPVVPDGFSLKVLDGGGGWAWVPSILPMGYLTYRDVQHMNPANAEEANALGMQVADLAKLVRGRITFSPYFHHAWIRTNAKADSDPILLARLVAASLGGKVVEGSAGMEVRPDYEEVQRRARATLKLFPVRGTLAEEKASLYSSLCSPTQLPAFTDWVNVPSGGRHEGIRPGPLAKSIQEAMVKAFAPLPEERRPNPKSLQPELMYDTRLLIFFTAKDGDRRFGLP